ncbi:MAG: hypothetical protein JXR69_10130 [Candidatus Delongbacteria bacterium]|nr:hypothetical protein [Candidatus Delongbacteria bacterium]
MKKIFFIFALITVNVLLSQDAFTKRLIDTPTAYSLNRAEIEIGGRLYASNGMMGEVNIGVFENFFFGVSYGTSNIIGDQTPAWNGQPGMRIQFLAFKEDFYYPNVSVGFDSQGAGQWLGDRFAIKSKGFYLVLSKNYYVAEGQFGTLGFHWGVNYCVTEEDPYEGDDNINMFIGFDKSIVPTVNLLCEYDFAWNDNSKEGNNKGNGYLNIGLRWSFENVLHLEFDVKDILKNTGETLGREVRVIYTTAF